MATTCYNEGMELLLPGYPTSNPILMGLAAIAGGEDLDLALAQRDAQVDSPAKMVGFVFEALSWIPRESFLLEDLVAQGARAWKQLSPEDRANFMAEWNALPQLPTHCQTAVDSWTQQAL